MHMGHKGRGHKLWKFFLEPLRETAVIGEFPAYVVLHY
jgi:hypothetical protein